MSDLLLLDHRTQSLVEAALPDAGILERLVEFFAVFSDGTRLKILSALSVSEMCVTDLARVLKMNQTTVSHQLRYLKTSGFVTVHRLGKVVFYQLAKEEVNTVLLYGVEFLGY